MPCTSKIIRKPLEAGGDCNDVAEHYVWDSDKLHSTSTPSENSDVTSQSL